MHPKHPFCVLREPERKYAFSPSHDAIRRRAAGGVQVGPARKGAAGRSGPGLGPGPMALRPILGVMGRPIFSRCYGLMAHWILWVDPNIFFIILNHEYYQHFLEKIRFKIKTYHNNILRLLAMHQIKYVY